MPKYPHRCPAHLELDLYSGCPFNCLYCVTHDTHATESAPGGTAAHFLTRVAETPPLARPVYLSPATDAYQPLEEANRLARAVLEELSTHDRAFFVITKSPLILRDREYFAERPRSFIALSLNSLAPEVTDRLEPGAPPIRERREAAEELAADHRLKLVVKIDPVLPGLTDEKRLDELLQWLVTLRPYAVTAETLRLSQDIWARMRPALTTREQTALPSVYPHLDAEPRHAALPYRLKIFHRIMQVLVPAGIRTCFCRASLPSPLTPHDCRGGYP
ncbi:MAG TPA: radical SAM protein [Spirochaetia bacterium]|nr:radical SAM protein [Spirochaetia bacterium]